MQAFGYFNVGHVIAAAPMIRIGVGFGRDRVVATPAIVDTGSDLCVFPASLAQGLAPEKGEPVVILEMADGKTREVTVTPDGKKVGGGADEKKEKK